MPPAMAIQCGAPNDVPPARKQTPHLHPSITLMLNLRLILITVFPFIAVLPLIGFLAPLTLYFLPRQTSHSSAPDMSVRAPIVLPALARHTATVIFIHGLGDTGAGWADAAQLWQSGGRLNDVKFILPHAPQIPITMNGGMHMPGWFDVKNVGSLTQPGAAVDEDEAGVLNSRTYIYSLIQAEIDAGISSDRIIVGGFSQGGAMSILSGLTAPYKLGGVVGLSSWLLLNSKFESLVPKDSQNKATKIFMGHGSADPLVRYPMGKASEEKLKGLGYDVTFKTYPGMQHSACMEEFKDVEEFIHGRLN